MKRFPLIFFCLLGLTAPGRSQTPNPIVGVWTGSNDQGHQVRIEFSPEGYYLLSVDGRGLTSDLVPDGQIRYRIIPDAPPFRIALFSAQDQAGCGDLQAALYLDDRLELIPVAEGSEPDPETGIRLHKVQEVAMDKD